MSFAGLLLSSKFLLCNAGHILHSQFQLAKILSEVFRREIQYKNPNPVYFLIESMRRGSPFMFALVMMGLYTSTRFGMAEPITNEVEKLTGRKPISFKEFANDYKENWM